jgi:gas vesicle protein
MLDVQDMLREREDSAANQGFATGMLVGILVGVVLALIFAPRRGDETRTAVSHKAVEIKDTAVDLVHRGVAFRAHEDVDQDGLAEGAAIERDIGADGEIEPVTSA